MAVVAIKNEPRNDVRAKLDTMVPDDSMSDVLRKIKVFELQSGFLARDRRRCRQLDIISKSRRIRKKRLKENVELRTGWSFVAPNGPWDDEHTNYTKWRDPDTGYLCVVRRALNHGQWNGYVLVDRNHPLSGRDYRETMEELEWMSKKQRHAPSEGAPDYFAMLFDSEGSISSALNTHGGVTYGGWNYETGLWSFGFDTAHCDDVAPALTSFLMDIGVGTYKDRKYVMDQAKSLARQIKQAENVLRQAGVKAADSKRTVQEMRADWKSRRRLSIQYYKKIRKGRSVRVNK